MSFSEGFALAKPCIDIGYFTNEPERLLAFWRDDMGLAFEAPVEFNDGLTQHRHALGDSVIKINTRRAGSPASPSSFTELLIAQSDRQTPETIEDPDGNRITLVPVGHLGIEGLGLRLSVRDQSSYGDFLHDVMRFERISESTFRSGNSMFFLEEDANSEPAGHWTDRGLRYFTLHVMRVDDCFQQMIDAGAAVGEKPYSIGKIARISFVRDPHGNWIEVAQRASLAGLWD